MKKRLLVTLAILSILLVSSALLTSSRAADYSKLGVKSGDNSTYAFSLVNSTVNLQGTLVANVTEVTGTNATLSLKYYFANGTLAAAIILGPDNVSTGQGGINFFLICADLSAYDPINLATPLIINETIDMVAAGLTRTVNHLNITMYATRYNIWWDKSTGLAVQLTILGPFVLAGLGNLTLTSTSLWSPGGLPITTLLLIIGVGAIAVVAAVAIVLHRRGK
jgi:hypothetical protein